MSYTKIICTIGPATSGIEATRSLVKCGMNVARVNFSHGSYDEHSERITQLKQVRQELGVNIAILQDLSGPKIRVGKFPEGQIQLRSENFVVLKSEGLYEEQKTIAHIPVSFDKLAEDAEEGARILLDDGMLEMIVERIEGNNVRCRVIRGGTLKDHKGVNFPDLRLSQGAPTQKDIEDLRFGVKMGVDFVALSFVQSADDIRALRGEIQKLGGKQHIVAKLEREVAIRDLDAIVDASDAVMVARGDLGIEADIAMVPIYQKQIVDRCITTATPVIVATQMLESMISSPLPTRAEVNDVANAIYDGADAIMLSGETAVGSYPFEAVAMMRRIADNVEAQRLTNIRRRRERSEDLRDNGQRAVANAVCRASESLGAKAIVAQSISGQTARLMSMYRPSTSIIAITPSEETYYQLALVWGVKAVYVREMEDDFMKTVKRGDQILIAKGYLKKGDLVVISAGIPPGESGGTNIMKLHYLEG